MTGHKRRIVITGLGTVNPIAFSVNEFWDNLCKGKNGVRKAQNTALGDYHVQIAAEIDLPDIRDFFRNKRMARRLDRCILLNHVAGVQAVKDAGLTDYPYPERVGTIIGTGAGGLSSHQAQINKVTTHGLSSVTPFYVSSAISNTASAMICMEFGFNGPSFAVSSACASSNHVFGIAFNMIENNFADIIIAGGTEATGVEVAFGAFGQIGALSMRNDDPATASRPFDQGRDGFVIGEGAGILCMEELEHAKKRGAHIYAEVSGFSFTSDGYDLVAPDPEGRGAARAINGALEMAKMNPEDIGFINCHGTSTPLGDLAECIAVNRALASHVPNIPVHSTKSMIGHLLGAASAVEAIAGIMAFERGIIHHTINQFTPDPKINYTVIKEPMEKRVNHFLSNAFAFGGHNACVIFSRFSE